MNYLLLLSIGALIGATFGGILKYVLEKKRKKRQLV